MEYTELTKEPILIVDDVPTMREVLDYILRAEGFKCDQATGGTEALALLEEKKYALMITDIHMDGMDGLQLLRETRSRWPHMQVIIGTCVDERDTALDALENGAVGYMIKPFEQVEVLVNVRNALRLRHLEKAHRRRQEELEIEIEKRTLELMENHRKMVDQEKLASVGQLAAGVAHEVNNPTGYIASNLRTLRKYLERLTQYLHAQQELIDRAVLAGEAEELKGLRRSLKIDSVIGDSGEIVEDSLQGAERIRRIVMGLKSFSRREAEEPQLLDLNEVLDETLMLCRNELKYKADIIREFEEIPQVEGLRQKLSQVFLNLLVNAAQAIEDQGRIVVGTRRVDQQVEVRITDTGVGISPENLDRIFEPFFTTKQTGVGTGLGLAIAQDIVTEHKGQILVESRVGEGSLFCVRLPIPR